MLVDMVDAVTLQVKPGGNKSLPHEQNEATSFYLRENQYIKNT